MKKYIAILIFFISILWSFNPGFCRSWDDLEEGEHEIYGSEKEKKYPVRTPLWELEDWENHYSNMVLGLYKHTDYPKYRSTRALPFYYSLDSKIDNRTMAVWPLFLTWLETDGNIETSTVIFPLYGSTIDTKKDSYDRRFLLLWWGRDNYSSGVKRYQTLFPLSYHSSEVNEKTGGGEYLWVNPLFVSWRDSNSATEDHEHMWWMPIIPLVTFNYVGRSEGHRNFFLLMDYSWDIVNGEDSMKRFWFIPVVFWEKGEDGYTSFFPVYINNRFENGDYYFQVLPFYLSWKDTGAGTVTDQKLTLLFAKRSVADNKTGEEVYSNFWFPVIPLYFKSRDRDEGTHTNILGIFDWKSDKDGSFKDLNIFPVKMHGSANTEKEGYSCGIFHYHNWSESHNRWWAWLYYSNEEYVNKPAAKGSRELPEKEEFYYRHFLPLYWSWKSQESTGTLIIPFVGMYQDRQTDIHVNLTGYASSSYMGPFSPQIMAGLANKEDTWYLDTDISWLYDVISVSARVPIKNPFAADNSSQVTEKPADDKNTVEEKTAGIVSKKEMNRENSGHFWGWKVLFGWMAYEKADSKRHFRLLPLSWFTWDENADDKLYVFLPVFLSYKSEADKEEYFVIAPFYGAQYQDRSYAKAYLINLYWDEFEAEKDYHEKSLIWPFINWYSSPEKDGFRFFPLFWYRGWKEGSDNVTQTFSPLHYSKSIQDGETGIYKYRKRINPFCYLRDENSENNQSYSLFVPLIPLFYHGTESDQASVSSTTITPLFYYNTESKKQDEAQHESTSWAPLLPLYYSYSSPDYSHWNFLGIIDRCTDRDYSRFFFLPFYYGTREKDSRHRNFLGIIDLWSGEKGYETTMFFPFWWWSGDDKSDSLLLFPVLSYLNTEPGERTRFIAGLYLHEAKDYERQNFLYLFDHKKYSGSGNRDEYSMLLTTAEYDVSPEIKEMRMLWGALFKYRNYRNSSNYDIDALLWLAGMERTGGYFHHRVLPLYWYSSDKYETILTVPVALSLFTETGNGNFDLGLLGLVYYRNEDRSAGEDRRMWLLGTLYSEVKYPERKYHSRGSLWGWLWDYETEDETGFRRFTVFRIPLFREDGKTE